MKNTIPIFFTVDDDYAPYLDCAVRSIADNASKSYDYRIIVIHINLSERSMERIASASSDFLTVDFIPMPDGLEDITDRVENRLRCDYFTLTIYFRLFIADMFPEYNKGIYIDSDVIIPGDISQMYEIQLGDNIFGACPDRSVSDVPELAKYMEKAVGVDSKKYVNSGVLLMNLALMRKIDFSGQFMRLLNKFHFDCVAPDQDYINAMCTGRILFLDDRWDVMPPEEGKRELISDPKLIHYNLFQKPWMYDNIPYEEYFWKYAEQSPFYRDILDFKAGYSDEAKQSDAQCLADLIAKADAMDKRDVTFKKIYESGEKIRI